MGRTSGRAKGEAVVDQEDAEVEVVEVEEHLDAKIKGEVIKNMEVLEVKDMKKEDMEGRRWRWRRWPWRTIRTQGQGHNRKGELHVQRDYSTPVPSDRDNNHFISVVPATNNAEGGSGGGSILITKDIESGDRGTVEPAWGGYGGGDEETKAHPDYPLAPVSILGWDSTLTSPAQPTQAQCARISSHDTITPQQPRSLFIKGVQRDSIRETSRAEAKPAVKCFNCKVLQIFLQQTIHDLKENLARSTSKRRRSMSWCGSCSMMAGS